MLGTTIIKHEIMEKHTELVRRGKLEVARNLLVLLRLKTIRLGSRDSDVETEFILEELGLVPKYSRNYLSVRFHL